jgi:hypothetical protein
MIYSERLLISINLSYLINIILLNIKTYQSTCVSDSEESYVIINSIQLAFNTILYISSLFSDQSNFVWNQIFVFFIIIPDIILIKDSNYQLIQAFLDLFGYLLILYYWSYFKVPPLGQTTKFREDLHRLSYIAHLIFSCSVFVKVTYNNLNCETTPLRALVNCYELALLGSILGYQYGKQSS